MKVSKNKWDRFFLNQAKKTGYDLSKDRSTKVGAIIVRDNKHPVSMGYNGFPKGIDDDNEKYHERPLKYKICEHAERNAIYYCAKEGISSKDCKIYTSLFPCTDCTRGIIGAGIVEVCVEYMEAYEDDDLLNRWGEDFNISKNMLDEAGIKITYIKL